MKSPVAKQGSAEKPNRKTGGLVSHPRFVLIALAVVAVAAAWAGWRHFGGRGREGIRHIVLISVDTCRADRLSCYGYKKPSTPNVDALAGEGVLFKNAFTPVPMTTPAHSSMMTGTYPPTHGVRMNNGEPLAASNVTLAEVLRKAGYRTAAFVGGFPLDAQFGINQGFETYDCQFSKTSERSKTVGERTADEVNAPALAWLEEYAGKGGQSAGKAGEKPFFLFLHYFDAHAPYEPPAPYSSDFADDLYAGEIAHVDHCIGQVMDRLRALGAYDDTVVIVVGDHGESLGDHGERTHASLIYQSTLHVPMVIRVPGGGGGRQVEANASLGDIVPTVLDLIGLKSPPAVQGVSLRAALESGAAPDRKQPVYCESLEAASFGCSPLHGVVEGPWKYIRAPRQELYDLKGDPAEQANAIEKEPAVARRLRGRLEAMLQEMESAAAQRGHSAVDPEALKKLGGLGYMSGGVTPASSAFDPTLEDPKDFQPTYERLQKANRLFLANQGQEAKTELFAIAAGRPTLVTAQAMLAQIAVNERRLADAAAYCERIVAILAESKATSKPAPVDAGELRAGTLDTRDLATSHFNLAVVLKEMGKLPEAIGQYEEALRIKPDSAEAHFNLGVALAQAGKAPEAMGQYREAVRIKPDYAEAYLNLGAGLQQMGKAPEEIEQYEQALRARPEYAEAHYNLAMALQRTGQLPEAIGHFERALRFKPEYAADSNLTSALAAARRANEALDSCRQALRTNPDDAQAHNNLGGLLRQIGRVAEGIGQFEQALRINPDFAEAHYNLALATAQMGKVPEAIGHYTEALRLKPDFLPALNNLAWIRATQADPKLRDGAEAVRLAEHACQLSARKEWGFLDTLAAAYAEAGRFADAVAAAQEALALVKSANQPAAADEIQSRLAMYKASQAFHEVPPKMP